ncbi:MAG TPA: hypothetical protein VGT82_06870, partial [Ktedonobacteraceae bacterium]|nr:hypothetical protein [Ktedonobacteraceae bacterium]
MNSQSLPPSHTPDLVGTRFSASSDSSPDLSTLNYKQSSPTQSDATSPDAFDKISMVEIRDLKKSYTLKPVLRGINL